MIVACFCNADLLIVFCFNNWCIDGFTVWKWSYKEIHGNISLWNATFCWCENIPQMYTGFDKAVDFPLSRMDLMVMSREVQLNNCFWNLSFSSWKLAFWQNCYCDYTFSQKCMKVSSIFQHKCGFFGKYSLKKKKNNSQSSSKTNWACMLIIWLLGSTKP